MIIFLIFGFIAGTALGSFLHVTIVAIGFVAVLSFCLFVWGYIIQKNSKVLIASVFLIGLTCGLVRVTYSQLYSKSQLDQFATQKISAEGTVIDEPDEREQNVKLTVLLSKIVFNSETKAGNEKILVTVPLYPHFHYGDRLAMNIVLQKPDKIASPDGRVFDYPGYLKVRDIWYVTKFADVHLVSSGHGAIIKDLLFKIKNSFTNALNNALPEPESSLMAGLLLGTKQSLGKDLLLEFQRAGVSHVVVLSGYNIAIVAESIMVMLSFLPQVLSFSFGTIGIVLFTILSGGGASAWRAAIMVLVALFAKKINRDYSASRAFGLAIVVMLLFNPLLLVFDPSFQLSVLATIGLIFVSPFVSPYLKKIPERYGKSLPVREIVSSTIATQIVVLPYLIYTTGIVSLTSLPVNILILGTIPLTMLLGFVVGVVGLFSLYLSFIPAFFAYIFLWYQLAVVHIGATLPFGVVTLPSFSPVILILVYMVIFLSLIYMQRKIY